MIRKCIVLLLLVIGGIFLLGSVLASRGGNPSAGIVIGLVVLGFVLYLGLIFLLMLLLAPALAFAEIEKNTGKQFDPTFAVAFLALRERIIQEMQTHAEPAIAPSRCVQQLVPA